MEAGVRDVQSLRRAQAHPGFSFLLSFFLFFFFFPPERRGIEGELMNAAQVRRARARSPPLFFPPFFLFSGNTTEESKKASPSTPAHPPSPPLSFLSFPFYVNGEKFSNDDRPRSAHCTGSSFLYTSFFFFPERRES